MCRGELQQWGPACRTCIKQKTCMVRQARRQIDRPTSRLILLTDPTQTSAMSGYLRARSFTCNATGKVGSTLTLSCSILQSTYNSPVTCTMVSAVTKCLPMSRKPSSRSTSPGTSCTCIKDMDMSAMSLRKNMMIRCACLPQGRTSRARVQSYVSLLPPPLPPAPFPSPNPNPSTVCVRADSNAVQCMPFCRSCLVQEQHFLAPVSGHCMKHHNGDPALNLRIQPLLLDRALAHMQRQDQQLQRAQNTVHCCLRRRGCL